MNSNRSALKQFKRNKVAILVATDIAARGLDIDELPHVVNYELPMVASDYMHRIGRTGRAGTGGDAISLVCVDERPMLAEIETLLGHRVEQEIIDGFAPDRSIRPQPIQTRSANHVRQASQIGRPARPDPTRRWQPDPRPVHQRPSRPAQSGNRPAQGGNRPPQGSIGRLIAMPGERLRSTR